MTETQIKTIAATVGLLALPDKCQFVIMLAFDFLKCTLLAFQLTVDLTFFSFRACSIICSAYRIQYY